MNMGENLIRGDLDGLPKEFVRPLELTRPDQILRLLGKLQRPDPSSIDRWFTIRRLRPYRIGFFHPEDIQADDLGRDMRAILAPCERVVRQGHAFERREIIDARI